MASHRKPRTRILQSATGRRGAVGVTTAALASVTLLSQSASATPSDDSEEKPSLEEVKKKVDGLYQQAGAETQKYNAAKERSERQREKVDGLLDRVAKRTDKLNDARRVLGNYAAAQYRTGGMSETATLLLTKDPQGFFKQSHLMDRMTSQQKDAVTEFQQRQKSANTQRAEATEQLESLDTAQRSLKERKQNVQSKLSEARELLSELTAQEKARLAQIEKEKRAEAQRKAKERAEAERRKAAQEQQNEGSGGSESGSGSSQGDSGSSSDGYAAKAEKVLSYAEQQLGKPYVWGATGPNSYDCSGLPQEAWKTAGISLPRTTYDQVKVGTQVAKSEMRPGDLIFFYDDVSHVGIYVGDGRMIHASKPGDDVKYEAIDYMPFHSAVRPA
ncbi:NlpC/P60 family protein [Streptomyces xiaopingdaonensis]|uniref:C40 family peptidase n=1 Tax=Streptomyces xiaopingdaonensis TaxID=1565415 RepID=UPI000316C121|nr:C40 family peptidase [Streptomyces xiaopingdaonensis]